MRIEGTSGHNIIIGSESDDSLHGKDPDGEEYWVPGYWVTTDKFGGGYWAEGHWAQSPPDYTDTADTISGGGGSDDIHGYEGNDFLYGGEGNDTIEGDAGNDALSGSTGADSLVGGDGNDRIAAGSGNDDVAGSGGNDMIEGGDGNDTIEGGDGNDTIEAGGGDDRLAGSGGRDDLVAGSGDDLLEGGAGKDTLEGGTGSTGQTDTLAGGTGKDSFVFHYDPGASNHIGSAANMVITDAVKGEKFVFDSDGEITKRKNLDPFVSVADDGHDVTVQFTTSGFGTCTITFKDLSLGNPAITSLNTLGKVLKLSFI